MEDKNLGHGKSSYKLNMVPMDYNDRNLTNGEEEIDVVRAHVVLGEVHDGALQRHLAVMVGGNLKYKRVDGDTILKISKKYRSNLYSGVM
jgi:hypothetical protein